MEMTWWCFYLEFSLSRARDFPRKFNENGRKKLLMVL